MALATIKIDFFTYPWQDRIGWNFNISGVNKMPSNQRINDKDCQVLIGHSCRRRTRVYTHVSQKDFAKFKNPFDDAIFDDG